MSPAASYFCPTYRGSGVGTPYMVVCVRAEGPDHGCYMHVPECPDCQGRGKLDRADYFAVKRRQGGQVTDSRERRGSGSGAGAVRFARSEQETLDGLPGSEGEGP